MIRESDLERGMRTVETRGPRLSSIHALFIVATNTVPLIGVARLGWSTGTLLAIFWAETLLAGTANVVRIVLHRRWTGKRGHYRAHFTNSSKQTPATYGTATLLGECASVTYIFSLGHGLFLGILLAILAAKWTGEGENPWRIDVVALGWAVVAIAVFSIAELVLDVPELPSKPFKWIRVRAQTLLGRVVVLHLAIIFGTFTLSKLDRPLAFLSILIVLKILFELGTAMPERPPPRSPPRWLAWIAELKGLDAQAEWQKANEEQTRLEERDEEDLRAAEPV